MFLKYLRNEEVKYIEFLKVKWIVGNIFGWMEGTFEDDVDWI